MPPDVQQLQRIQAFATRAGLILRPVDLDRFLATYQPIRYRQFALPPAFVWLCTLCESSQLSRIFIHTALGDPSPLQQLNDDTRRDLTPWPEYLVAFGLTGDESFCFAYNTPDSEPAIVIVNSYSPYQDPDPEQGERYIDWHWFADDFERWLSTYADWLPEADAKSAAWDAEFKARHGKGDRKTASSEPGRAAPIGPARPGPVL